MPKVTIVTCKDYHLPEKRDPYIDNIFSEYNFIRESLERRGIEVERTYWDNPTYNWSNTDAAIVRTTWDYFERIEEFAQWLEKVNGLTKLINPLSLINWNIDKNYLADLSDKGVEIVPTVFVEKGEHFRLLDICKDHNWKKIVIKPAISGAAFHTYKIEEQNVPEHQSLFEQLCMERAMLVQEYQETITTKGEASLMVFNGRYTHAILKRAKAGDFRVQDDFGGTVHHYEPSENEIAFAEEVFRCCEPMPAYGRVDIIWDDEGKCYLSELEIIEPEIWIRNNPPSAEIFADGVLQFL